MLLSVTVGLLAVACLAPAEYVIPEPKIELLWPQGLRVSIPDSSDLVIFGFRANLNRKIQPRESGDIRKDVVVQQKGKWVFEDKNVKIRTGDVLNYWIFVFKGGNGYFTKAKAYKFTSVSDKSKSEKKSIHHLGHHVEKRYVRCRDGSRYPCTPLSRHYSMHCIGWECLYPPGNDFHNFHAHNQQHFHSHHHHQYGESHEFGHFHHNHYGSESGESCGMSGESGEEKNSDEVTTTQKSKKVTDKKRPTQDSSTTSTEATTTNKATTTTEATTTNKATTTTEATTTARTTTTTESVPSSTFPQIDVRFGAT